MTKKKKIAVLGGGTGSMSTVWALTGLENWQDRFDITVYQMGWRLGGKGASGRDPEHGMRIEEHGLHIWAGFYENAFRLMRDVYAEADRPEGAPLATWREAFHEHSDVIIEEFVNGTWEHWDLEYPTNDEVPGDGDILPDAWDYVKMSLELIWSIFTRSPFYEQHRDPSLSESLWNLLTGGDDRPEVTPTTPDDRTFDLTELSRFDLGGLIEHALKFAKWLPREVGSHLSLDHVRIITMLTQALDWLRGEFYDVLDANADARHLYIALDVGLATVKGLILDRVIFDGFEVIDRYEWVEWLRRWGCSEYTIDSVMIRGIYDYVFGYVDGDIHRPSVGAGTAIHGCFRLVFTYKGSLFYTMQGGMGDVVYAPMYQVLKDRGVKFEFFHRVENLGLNGTGSNIERITMTKQATLKDPTAGYEPLFDVKGLPCWPNRPLWDQLVEGETLRDQGINLETRWSPWEGVGEVTLERGVDFDEVVLGIPSTCYEQIAPELVEANARFGDMARGLKSTPTVAVQLWLDEDARGLGAPTVPVIVTGYVDPINTWADLSHLLVHEDWPEIGGPEFLAYFCGPWHVDPDDIPPFTDTDYPAREKARAMEMTRSWLASNTGHIWTQAGTRSSPASLDYALLHSNRSGVARLKDQYVRVNVDNTERYILSTPGTTALRMKAGDTGFGNLVMAGDWVLTSITAGCIECAVMAGLHAAEAVSGDRIKIIGRAY